MAKELTIDIETYSTVDIKTSGVYKYITSSDFELLTITLSINDEAPITYDLASGEELPLDIVQDLLGCVGKIEQTKKHKQFSDKISLKVEECLCQTYFIT